MWPPTMVSLAEGVRIDRIGGSPIYELTGIQPGGNGQVDYAGSDEPFSQPTIGLDQVFRQAFSSGEHASTVLSMGYRLIESLPQIRVGRVDRIGELAGMADRKDAPDTWEAPGRKIPAETSDWTDKDTWPINEACDEWKKSYHLTLWVPLLRQEAGTASQVVAGPGGNKMKKADAEERARKDAQSQIKATEGGKKKIEEAEALDRIVQDAIRSGKVKEGIVPGKGNADEDLRNRILWALRKQVIEEDLTKKSKEPPCSDDNCIEKRKHCATVIELLQYEVLAVVWSFEYEILELWEDNDLWHYKIKVLIQWWAQVAIKFSVSCLCADILGAEVKNPGEVPPEPDAGTPGPRPGEWKPKKDWKPPEKLPKGGIG